jgi:hypothetical protein
MGRKLKPIGLHRKAISLSLPLDIIAFLDNLTLSKGEGATRSRTLEAIIRTAMSKGQTTLNEIITKWECSGCGHSWRSKDPSLDYVFCSNCDRLQDKKTDLKGQVPSSWEEEEE